MVCRIFEIGVVRPEEKSISLTRKGRGFGMTA